MKAGGIVKSKWNLVLVLFILGGCKKKGEVDDRPPPISAGKCLVDSYLGSQAQKQTCMYAGYTWTCTVNGCDRVGEAGVERPPLADAALSGSGGSGSGSAGSTLGVLDAK